MAQSVATTDVEVNFGRDDLIVSKTDVKGRITYANQPFCRISGYAEKELIGRPHSIIRHPNMPRAVFKLIWDALAEGREIFAYVKNLTKSGEFYWVFAHVTPSFDADKCIVGFHSNRRLPNRKIVTTAIEPVYAEVRQQEQRHHNGQEALAAGVKAIGQILRAKKMNYDEFVFSL